MIAEDDERFALCISAMASTFGKPADEALFEGYRMALDDLPLRSVESAVRKAIRTCRFMPSGRELRELAGEMSPQTRAVQAWESLVRCISRHGYYTSVDFDDPVINATIRNLGGWERVCELEGDEFHKWLRKDFERVYLAILQGGVSASQAQPLVGFHERNNRFRGYLVGDALRLSDGTEEAFAPVVFQTGLPAHIGVILRETIPVGVRRELPAITFQPL